MPVQGKTTLAIALKRAVPQLTVVSFGAAIRSRARAMGLDSSRRDVLIELGDRWVRQDPKGICASVLEGAAGSQKVVVDGIRHVHIAAEMARQLAPSQLSLVLLDVPRALLVQRLTATGLDEAAAEAVLSGPSEVEIDADLRSKVDVVIDALRPADESVQLLAARFF